VPPAVLVNMVSGCRYIECGWLDVRSLPGHTIK